MIINLASYLKEKLTGKSQDKSDVTLKTDEKPKSTSTYEQDNGYSSEKTPTNDTKESNVNFTALFPNG